MRSNIGDSRAEGLRIMSSFKLGVGGATTLGAAVTVVDGFPTVQAYDAGGSSRNITFPTRAAVNDGVTYFILNLSTAGENLVLKDSDTTTRATVPAGGMGIMMGTDAVEAPGTRAWMGFSIGGEDLTLVDDLVVGDALTVTGAAIFSSTIAVSLGATLSSTLGIGKTATFSSNAAVSSTLDAQAVFSAKTPTLGKATSDVVGFYGGTGTSQRSSSNQTSTNIAVSASFGATQVAVIQEIMNTLTAASLWKGA